MDWSQLFSAAGNVALVGWLILILAPRRWPVLNAIPRYVIPAGLSLAYAGLVFVHFARTGGGFGSLDGVALLFSSEPTLLAGWVHYLAFDLFIGCWIAHESDTLGISRLVQAPILVATFMLGPIGLFLYLTLSSTLSLAGNKPAEA